MSRATHVAGWLALVACVAFCGIAQASPSVREYSIPLAHPTGTAHAAAASTGDRRSADDDRGGWRTFRIQNAPRFELVGLRWTVAPPEEVQLRTRSGRQPWTDWITPGEPESGEQGTAPVWTGASDRIQVRVRGTTRGLKLHAVRVRHRPRPALTGFAAGTVGTRTAGGTTLAGVLTPGTGGVPAMVTRAQWDPTNECAPREKPALGKVAFGIVHHTVSSNLYTGTDGPAMVLAICRYHRNGNRWNDVGYNFLVDRFGTIYEGRAGGIDQPVVGAHAQGFNGNSFGIANLGTFGVEGQTNDGLRATARLLAWKLGIHGVPLTGTVDVVSAGGDASRFRSGQTASVPRIAAHRDVGSTDCPGGALYGQLATIRSLSLQMPRGVPPAPVPVTPILGAVTVQTPNPTVPYGVRAQVGGIATTATGDPLPNAEVRIQAQTGTSWTTVGKSTTDAAGAWAGTVAALRSRSLRAVAFAGGQRAGTSTPLALAVMPALVGMTAKRVVARMPLTVTGTITPAKARVTLEIARQGSDGVYRTVARIAVRGTGGRLKHTVRLSRPALHRLRWVFAGDTHHAATRAPDLFVRAIRGGPVRGGAQAR